MNKRKLFYPWNFQETPQVFHLRSPILARLERWKSEAETKKLWRERQEQVEGQTKIIHPGRGGSGGFRTILTHNPR